MSPLLLWQSTLGNLRALRSLWRASQEATPRTVLGRLSEHLPVVSFRTGWLFYTAVCFVLFLVLTFPSEVLFQRLVASLLRESGVYARYAEGDCAWWRGCVLRDVALEGPAFGGTAVQLSRVTLHPALLNLFFSGQPLPCTFSAELYEGVFSGTVRQAVGGISVQLVMRQLALEHWPFPRAWGQGRITGSVTADGEFLGNPADLYALQGNFSVSLTDGAVRAGTVNGFPVPALQAVQVRLRASLAAGRVEISELNLHADGMEASLQGTITLRAPIARSNLDLQLTAKSTDSPSPAVKTLLSLLPASQTSSGERQASISGSLAAPVVR